MAHKWIRWCGSSALLAFLWLSPGAAAELENRMADSPSPYLQLHADDPVHWQPWTEATLALAARLDRPLYLSSGFYACHWCHVMQRESFRDPEVAARLNRDFIPVKIDREVDLATDDRLVAFLRQTEGTAGWPLNVIATPEGRPHHGFLYRPRDDFDALLAQAASAWSGDAETVRAEALVHDRAAGKRPAPQPASAEALRQALVAAAVDAGDDFDGGFGDQLKFPRTPLLEALLPLAADDPALDELLALTLEAIAGRGLHDHIGGGFFRYTEDPYWEEPHFEKMLYDNAQLAALFLRAGQQRDEPRWTAVGQHTLDFMLRDMARDRGGLISALAAEDADGVEGGPYLWTPVQLGRVLDGTLLPVAVRRFGMERPPLFDAGHLPVPRRDIATIATDRNLAVEEVERRLDQLHQQLLGARMGREVPADTKAVTAWNGLTLSALALAADEPRYRDAGDALATFIRNRLRSEDGLLRALGPEGEPLGNGGLEDYAFAARGLLDWAEALGEAPASHNRRVAAELAAAAWARFHDDAGWHPEERPLLRYGGAVALPTDGYLPAATAALHSVAENLADDDPYWTERTEALTATILDHAGRAPLDHASHIRRLR